MVEPKNITVDFDGTLVNTQLNDKLENALINKPLILYLNEKQKEGHNVILHTCRVGKELEEAIKFIETKGLIFNYAGQSPKPNNGSRKIWDDFGFDDRHGSVWGEDLKKLILYFEETFLKAKKETIVKNIIGNDPCIPQHIYHKNNYKII